MKRLPFLALLTFVTAVMFSSCGSDDDSLNNYADWREINDQWYNEQLELKNPNGTKFYSLLQPDWYKGSGVLIHYYNDRALTAGNLRPLSNSKVRVKYKGEIYNGAAFDSSYTEVDSCRVFTLGSDLILGWRIALADMHVGDSVDIIVPWQQAYGYSGTTGINPYSNLKFSIKLVSIPAYEIQ